MTHVATANNSPAVHSYWHLAPAVLALGYPWYLARFYDAAAAHHTFAALTAFAVVLTVPISAFVSLCSLGRQPAPTARGVILQRLAHFTFASPPLFVIVGVFLYLMKISGADEKVWLGIWAAVLCAAMLALLTSPTVDKSARAARRLAPVRAMHGVASATIILVFLFPHLGNHAIGIFGTDTHKAVMLVLRHLYRAGWLEPILIALFLFQIVSGLVLLLPKLGEKRDLLGTLQTASGAYLVIFIASHINAVFILARYFGTDTDYAWATGLPNGLIADSWNVRLIPHYSLGVWLILSHIICGLRTVMLAHGVSMPRTNVICWTLIGAASLWAAVVVTGMVGVRI
ncbi:hypothetical protein KB879_39045 (plasmid) [Cupriavidus sp. KK10]|jgi:hypothetical protein|uniref:hypothetical protein n=1 Tax=Cupriavidus sp. KK10 TaxID=1478019 RepID=UPI001BA91F0A|nr:hypothetical protein [Cupriavidus sp. KK10]QUN32195.1 hypothetical protein KB879_39045 [Cupriavidus sp. KK10]